MKNTLIIASLVTLCGGSSSSFAQPADIRQGMVAFWPLESAESSVTPDLTPFDNALNVNGAPVVGAGIRNNGIASLTRKSNP